MAWTNAQKSLFAQACKTIGYGQEQRHMVLSSFRNATSASTDHPTSTSKRLNNADFEHAMAIVENASGGHIKVKWTVSGKLRFGALHFARKADDDLARMRRLAGAIVAQLEASGNLEPNGVGLAGWIEKRITRGRTNRIDQLTYKEMHALINSLRSYSNDHGVKLDK